MPRPLAFADCHNDLLLGVTCQRDLPDWLLRLFFRLLPPMRRRLARTRLRDGARVEIDGGAGTITLV